MFTGIVQRLGVVKLVAPGRLGQTLAVDPGGWSCGAGCGESIAVNGCCLTVTKRASDAVASTAPTGDDLLWFDVISQTLETTTLGDLQVGDTVNLESAVTPTTALGGHVVQGHIDGVGVVRRVVSGSTQRALRIVPPASLVEYIVEKGSIAVDGVSLTVAALDEDWFEVALIPVTITATSLGRFQEGRRVNLETDYIVKSVVHWLRCQKPARR